MVVSTKSSMHKRFSSQLAPSFIGASFMSALCIKDRVSRLSSPSGLFAWKLWTKFLTWWGVSWRVLKTMDQLLVQWPTLIDDGL